MSRVIAALLTRIVGIRPDTSSDCSNASIEAGSATFSTAPCPGDGAFASAAVIWAAPSSEVAVPMTVAPAAASCVAIARPMPRVAPVTRAVSPCSMLMLPPWP